MTSKLLCFFGMHSYTHRFDVGRDNPIKKTGYGILFFSEDKVKCGCCGYVKDADWNKHKHLPELILKI